MRRHRKHATMKIKKMGSPLSVLRKTGGTTNVLGKTTGDSWEEIATESGVLNMSRGRAAVQSYNSGGEVDQQSPVVTLVYDTDAEDGDRVEVEGVTYEIQTLVSYPTHKVASLVSVNGEA